MKNSYNIVDAGLILGLLALAIWCVHFLVGPGWPNFEITIASLINFMKYPQLENLTPNLLASLLVIWLASVAFIIGASGHNKALKIDKFLVSMVLGGTALVLEANVIAIIILGITYPAIRFLASISNFQE